MLENIKLTDILFLDIETVPQHPTYEAMDERMKKLWNHKAERIASSEDDTPETLYPRAGIYAEFGRIVCISVGFVHNNILRIKSFYGHDEVTLLTDFAKLLDQYYSEEHKLLCAHNGKEFDFPYISRRMLINKIGLPDALNIAGKKPWEIRHLDTMELWKFGDYKNYTSLDLLTAIFDIPSPKDDISGADVWKVYWQEKDIERIKTYCQKDVVSLAQLMKAYRCESLFDDADISFV
ncbi:MAG: 3'-5' exonuclease [Bacteroidales bacterium]|nr:3'-5' exonuclease [Bacteroidales bacterium]